MAKARDNFTGILVQKKIISPEQIVEARTLQQQTGTKLQDAIVELGFTTAEEVVAAIAEFHNLPFINLPDMTIPASVVELVPESVARENVVLPLSQENGILTPTQDTVATFSSGGYPATVLPLIPSPSSPRAIRSSMGSTGIAAKSKPAFGEAGVRRITPAPSVPGSRSLTKSSTS